MKNFDQVKLRPVNRRQPCSICNKPDWCGITEDDAMAICMRISDGATAEARNGGFVHVLNQSDRIFTPKPTLRSVPVKPSLAPIDHRHMVYTALLELLTLSGHHGDDLLSRGLSDTEVARSLYASIPNQIVAAKTCEELARRFDLTGVPGFYQHFGCWKLAAWSTGFFVPVRDVQGRIQAMQIRFDRGELRYCWLTSAKHKGASSGTPIHFARPWRCTSTCKAIITEGALKAEVIAEHLDDCVIAVAGVGCFNDNLGEWLTLQLPALRSVLIGFDSDWHDKPGVECAMLRLMSSIESAGLTGGLLDWSGAKGLDDLLREEVGTCKA